MNKFETGAFQARAQMLVEGALPKGEITPPPQPVVPLPRTLITEADADNALLNMLLEAVAKKSSQDGRGEAAAAVLEWAESGDATWDSFDSIAFGIALEMEGFDLDEVGEDDITEDVISTYNDVLADMADAAVFFGASSSDVATMIDEEDDDAAASVMNSIGDIDDDEAEDLITTFTVGDDIYEPIRKTETDDSQMLLEATKKVVRNGKVKLIKKRIRPKKLNSAQRSALKKARRKANTSAAKVKRKKSMKLRRKRFGG